MHHVTRNELRLDFSITPVSPLSIQAKAPLTPGFVRALHPASIEDSAYIPATTLKGALRTAAAQIMTEAGVDCCDNEHPCAERDGVKKAYQAKDGVALFRSLCGLCRIFGSSMLRSHLTVTDCFPEMPMEALPIRDGDPLEVVLDEPFYGRLTLRNFERWQVGLLGLLLSRLNIAEVQLGGNRSSGMGCVALQYRVLTVVYPGAALNASQEKSLRACLHGAGQLSGSSTPYGLAYPDRNDTPDLPESAHFETGFGYAAVTITSLPAVPKVTILEEPVTQNGDGESVPDQPSESVSPVQYSAEVSEADILARTHGLIDNVLTRQAVAWGSFVRTQRGAPGSPPFSRPGPS